MMENSDGIEFLSIGEARGFYERYFGVCDVYSPEESRAMAQELRENRKDPDRKVMIGVMTHPLMLNPELPDPTGVREVFPSREEISAGFIDDEDVLNTVHYADLYGPNRGKDLYNNLEKVVEYGGPNLHAIQLDVTWPDQGEIEKFKQLHPELVIVLQLGKFAFEETDHDPYKILDRLDQYGTTIDYVLYDLSMGKGKGLNADLLLPILELTQQELPGLGLAVAGGLGPDSLNILEPIARKFPNISFDAQGNLKPPGSPRDNEGHLFSTIPADLDRTKTYIKQSCMMLD